MMYSSERNQRVQGIARRYYYVNEFTQKRTKKQLTCA
jgi:hypothetical protein